MMDFNEVGRRIAMKQCDCGTCNPKDMTHSSVAEPVVLPLQMAGGTYLLSAPEVTNLAMFVERQAEMLDDADEQITNMQAIMERADAQLAVAARDYKRMIYGLCAIAGVVLGMLIGSVQRLIL